MKESTLRYKLQKLCLYRNALRNIKTMEIYLEYDKGTDTFLVIENSLIQSMTYYIHDDSDNVKSMLDYQE